MKPIKAVLVPRGQEPAPFGLGDAVASVAQPIAKAIDAIAGTDIQNCGGCAKRKAYLNSLMPRLTHTRK